MTCKGTRRRGRWCDGRGGPGRRRCTFPCGLWLEVWNRSQNADDTARDRQAAIEGAWHRDLAALLAAGASRGEFRPVDPDRFGARLRALLDGFSIQWRSACAARAGRKSCAA